MISTPTHEQIGSLVPLETGRDYASEARDQVKKLEVKDDLHKFFLSLFEKKKQNEKEWLDHKKQWVTNRNYADGRQFGRVTNSCQWVDFELREGEQTFQDEALSSMVVSVMAELCRSVPELKFSHISPDTRWGTLVARIAESRYKIHRQRTFGALKNQQEKLSLLYNGIALRYTYWNANGRKEKVPVFGSSQVDMDDKAEVCSVCSAPMQGICPHCGSDESMEVESKGFESQVVSGYDDVETGETDWVSVDPMGVMFYLHAASLKDSPYLFWEQSIITEVLQSQYPDIRIVDGAGSRDMQDKSDLDASTPHDRYLADGVSTGKDTAEFTQGWFDPPLYANRIITKDVKLRNGQILRANDKLGKYYPQGLYLAKNATNILDVWNEDKMCKWTAAPYITRLGTLIGMGITSAISDQDALNDLFNLQMVAGFNDAYAKEFVNTQYLEGGTVPDGPNERGLVTNLPDGARIVGNAIDRLPPAPLAGDIYQLAGERKMSMQAHLNAFAGNAPDAPDLKAVQDTATGYLAWRNMMVGRLGPMLAAAADALDREQAYQFLENDQKYLTPEQWEKVKGDYGADGLKAFLHCDLPSELIVEVSGESYMPMSLQDERAKAGAFVQLVTEAQIDPSSEMGAFIGSKYDIPKSLVGFDAQKSIAYEMISAFKAISDDIIKELSDIPTFDLMLPAAAQMGALIVQVADRPISFKMDDLPSMAETFKDWWVTDEGRGSSNVLKAAVLTRMAEIDAAMVQKSNEDFQLQQAAQASAIQAEQAQMAAQNEAAASQAQAQQDAEADAAEREDANKEVDMIAQATTKVMDSEEKDKEREYQSKESEKQRSHELKLKQMDIKSRPKAKAA
jgi:hypothetical protein